MSTAAVKDVYHSIKAALDIFKSSAAATADVPSKQVLLQQAERVKTDAAKIGLMCSGDTPPADQLAGLAHSLQQSVVAFCSSCHSLTAVAGPTLKKALVKLAQDVVNPCLMLVKEMESGKDLKPHVAMVWDGIAAVSKAPLHNKSCLFKNLAGVMAVLKDTAREMEELQQEQQVQFGDAEPAAAAAADGSEQQAAAAAEGADDDDSECLDGYDGGRMSSIERQLLDSSLELVAAATATLKAFGRALLQGGELLAGSEVLEGWESCLFHCRHLQRAVEDLGAAVYAPQDFEEVASASLAVFEVTELMADECPDADAVGAEQLSSLAAQLTAAHERLQELLAQAQQEANNEGEEGEEEQQ
uniref:Cytochrome c domain-containing protein n=1 Tax=Tetradesmus obliquus TaxID=3088 RepID=A0A383W7V5_TETOB|eukprot:jgi/Sobl393_1/15663/SZX73074.1